MARSNKFCSALLLGLLLAISCNKTAEPRSKISKAQLQDMFDDMSRNPKLDINKNLLWGYFFTAKSESELKAVVPLLEAKGYRYVDIYLSEKEDPKEPDLWLLHVEKIEVHTPDTLYERNQELYRFANEHNLDSYDGMDVGPVPNA
jgi:hypothetical protein